MNPFTFVGGITSTVGKTIQKAVILPVANTISNTIKPGSGKATTDTFNSSSIGRVYTNALGAAVLALPIAAAGVGTVAKAAVTNPIKTSAVVIGGGVLSSSQKSQNVVSTQIAKAPSNLANFGTNIGNAVDNPSIASITEIAKENPILTSIVGAAAAYGTYKAVSPAVNAFSTFQNTQAIQEDTQAVIKGQSLPPQIIQIQQMPTPVPPLPMGIQAQSPAVDAPLEVAPAGQTAPKPKKKKKKSKKKTTKKKKKTRRSKKKKTTKKPKKKKKTIKRRKTKK